MKRVFAIILSLAMIGSLIGCGDTKEAETEDASETADSQVDDGQEDWPEVTLVLGHCMTEDSVINDIALYLQESVAEATNGSVQIEIYANNVLGSEVQQFESMLAGTVDMMITPPSVIVNFIPDFGIYDIPYLVQDFDHARAVWQSEVGQDLNRQLNEKGIQCFGVCDFGYRNTTNNVRPIVTPDDVKGLKMRTMSSEVSLALWEQLGAEPIAMAINEVFSALQTNVIDGQENPYTAIHTNGFYEVQEYCSATQHQYNMLNMVVTDLALSRMAEGQREAFISVFEGAEDASKEFMDKRTADSVAFMEEAGMKFNDCDLDAFREAAQPVIEKFADVYGAEKVELIQSLAP